MMPIREGLDNEQLTITALGVALAIVASIARAARKKTTLGRIVARALVSAVAAFVVGTLALDFTGMPAQTVLAVCGVTGWAGGEIMDILADALEARIKAKTKDGAP